MSNRDVVLVLVRPPCGRLCTSTILAGAAQATLGWSVDPWWNCAGLHVAAAAAGSRGASALAGDAGYHSGAYRRRPVEGTLWRANSRPADWPVHARPAYSRGNTVCCAQFGAAGGAGVEIGCLAGCQSGFVWLGLSDRRMRYADRRYGLARSGIRERGIIWRGAPAQLGCRYRGRYADIVWRPARAPNHIARHHRDRAASTFVAPARYAGGHAGGALCRRGGGHGADIGAVSSKYRLRSEFRKFP